MRITENNIENIPVKERALIRALLYDLKEINYNLPLDSPNLELEWIDTHTEYPPERTDPCPDYYGMYRIWRGNDFIGVEMDLDTLDSALCLLYNFVIEDD
jgi:hypothetical protein